MQIETRQAFPKNAPFGRPIWSCLAGLDQRGITDPAEKFKILRDELKASGEVLRCLSEQTLEARRKQSARTPEERIKCCRHMAVLIRLEDERANLPPGAPLPPEAQEALNLPWPSETIGKEQRKKYRLVVENHPPEAVVESGNASVAILWEVAKVKFVRCQELLWQEILDGGPKSEVIRRACKEANKAHRRRKSEDEAWELTLLALENEPPQEKPEQDV